jgi:uncharacterized membrane protein YeaQ/YmgE (transglycosylase-associated protein family)
MKLGVILISAFLLAMLLESAYATNDGITPQPKRQEGGLGDLTGNAALDIVLVSMMFIVFITSNLFIFIILPAVVVALLAGRILKDRGLGLIGNIVVGLIGSAIGYYGITFIAPSSDLVAFVMAPVVGAIVLILLVSLAKSLRAE